MSDYSLSDPNNPQPDDSAGQQQPAQSTAPAQPQQQPPIPQQATVPQPQQAQSNDNAFVTNTPHPAVQRAGVLRSVAEALAGGPRFTTTIDPNTGATTRVPLSSRDIGMAIALEAISGAVSGLAVTGPAATARAAAAGFQQTQQQMQQANAEQQRQAQQNFENQSQQLARRASIYESNSRSILNVATAENMGAEALDKLADINRASGVLDVDPSLTDNGGTPMTQQELMDAMKAGKLSPTDQLGPVAGRVEITNPDGSKRWEAMCLTRLPVWTMLRRAHSTGRPTQPTKSHPRTTPGFRESPAHLAVSLVLQQVV